MKRWVIIAALKTAAILLLGFLIGVGIGHSALFSGVVDPPAASVTTYHM